MKYRILDAQTGDEVDRNLTLDEALLWRDQSTICQYLIETMKLVEPTNEEREEPS